MLKYFFVKSFLGDFVCVEKTDFLSVLSDLVKSELTFTESVFSSEFTPGVSYVRISIDDDVVAHFSVNSEYVVTNSYVFDLLGGDLV